MHNCMYRYMVSTRVRICMTVIYNCINIVHCDLTYHLTLVVVYTRHKGPSLMVALELLS